MLQATAEKTATFIRFGDPEVARVIKDDPASVVSGNPVQGSWLYSDDTQTGSRFGIWECSAGKFRAKMDGHTEFCHILEGEAHIKDLDTGNVHTVKAGDSFVMEEGFDTEWDVPNYIKKCFAISNLTD